MMRLFGRKAQSTGEYAIVISLVVAAAIAMQTYVKRGLQGKIAKAVTNISVATGISEATGSTNVQYEPYYSESDFSTTTAGKNSAETYTMKEKTLDGGGFEKYLGSEATGGTDKESTRTGTKKTKGPLLAD
jgi:hypothetical protein